MEIQWGQVFGGQNGNNTGQRQSGVLIDRHNPCMGIGRADKISVQHIGKFDVIDIVALALGEPGILDAFAGAAKALEVGRAFFAVWSHIVHCAASLAALISLAAERMDLTIF